LTSIKDADCDPVIEIMSRAFPAKDAASNFRMQGLRPPEVLVASCFPGISSERSSGPRASFFLFRGVRA
jgi:hypothetical protein